MAGIYLHVPFCKQACTYCNFHFSTSLKYKDEMIDAILCELALKKNYLSEGEKIHTIYLGGGTPSLLTPNDIHKITDAIANNYDLNQLQEFTIETNPDDLTQAYIKSLRSTMLNRFSIGVQSFFDADLKYMNRAHNAQQAVYAIKSVQDSGFENITVDLIYGTPTLPNNHWKENLIQVQKLQIPHLSAYALTVEENTALYHHIQKKKSAPVDAEQSAQQFEMLMDFAIEAGYEHYEISNLATNGNRAVHNTNYWLGIPYIGIGPSAHSFDGKSREWNIANNALYIKALLTEKKLNAERENLTNIQRFNEYIMTSLRTSWGIDTNLIVEKFGTQYAQQTTLNSKRFIEQGTLQQNNSTLILTRAGKLFADYIASQLFMDNTP